ncbi:MAG: hypothetical protein UV60_C0003G0037 [Parcubacteria group bacterium GW2011_GWA2_43_11]|nr:MAG: hypothetical protein UV60_C0003G0037 [Parcubacteria group bacterium GW2011_GWA2_43_11]
MSPIHFYKTEELLPTAYRLFKEEKDHILTLCPNALVEHVGATSIPGSLTLGDLDIQIRVTAQDFQSTCEKIKSIYYENHPYLWTSEFALFHKKDHPDMPMSIMVTIIDTRFDEFYKTRDLLKKDKDMLEKYNTLKSQFEGKSLEEYKKSKREFFGPNGQNRLLNSKK